jgi:uncharacterized membrane protein
VKKKRYKVKEAVDNLAKLERESRQLRRLETLIDVVFAIIIWRAFMLIPRPGEGGWNWLSITDMLASNVLTLIIAVIGVVVAIVYWLQNNALFGNLDRTDGFHTALSILQLFFLLLFLYSIQVGATLEASTGTRAFESCTAALVGIAAALGWFYAIKNRRLVSPDLSDQEARDLQIRTLAEPITAVITLPCAFIGPWIWEASWLLYPLIVSLLKRRIKAGK